VIVLGDFQFHGTYPLYVYFDNALGLPEKGPVKVAGVEVGQVERIDLENQRARVKVRVRNGLSVPQGSKSPGGVDGVHWFEIFGNDAGGSDPTGVGSRGFV
jgi:hypothetical protein